MSVFELPIMYEDEHSAVFDFGNQPAGDEMVMPFMAAFATVLLGQLDAVALNVIHRADMNAIGANDFGMFLNLRKIGHRFFLWLVSTSQRLTAVSVPRPISFLLQKA